MPEQQLQLEPYADGANGHARPGVSRFRNRLAGVPRRARPVHDGIPEGPLQQATYRRDAAYRRSLGLADVASAVIAVLIGVPVMGNDALNPLAIFALPLVLLVGKLTGIYDRDEHLLRKTTLDEVPTLFWVATLYAFLIWLGGDLIVDGQFGRDQAVGVWALLLASMLATRALARYVARAVSDCMKGGLPGDTLRVSTEERARGGPCSCCTLDWISVASGSTSA